MNNKKPIIPINELTVKHTRNLVNAMAFVQTIHPIVTGYQKAILKEIEAIDKDTGKPITDPFSSYRLTDEKFRLYLKRCDEEAAKNKLTHKPECCPLLEAESLEREAKRTFGEYVLPFLPNYQDSEFDDFHLFVRDNNGNIETDKLGRSIFISDKIVDLALNLVIPFINPEDLKFK